MPKVTHVCVDCGKERIDYPSAFRKLCDEYRCSVCTNRKNALNPKYIENHKKAMQKLNQDSNFVEKRKVRLQKLHLDPIWKENVKKANQKHTQDPVWIKNNRKGAQKRMQNPEYIEKLKKSGQKLAQNPEWKKKNKEGAQKKTQYPNWRESVTGEGFWYGHHLLKGKIQKHYCELWNPDLWKRIDAAWDYKSAISGKTWWENNGRALTRHHVYWQEKACCVWDEDVGGYYTMINIGTYRNPEMYKHYINGDPNKFVLLTREEHSMITGKKKLGTNKLTWIKFFEDLIEGREKEGKKCYLSPEEYEIYKKENADTINYFTQRPEPKINFCELQNIEPAISLHNSAKV